MNYKISVIPYYVLARIPGPEIETRSRFSGEIIFIINESDISSAFIYLFNNSVSLKPDYDDYILDIFQHIQLPGDKGTAVNIHEGFIGRKTEPGSSPGTTYNNGNIFI